MKRSLVLVIATAAAAGWAAFGATGAGGPSAGLKFGSSGLLSRDRSVRYVTLPAGGGTVVEALRADDGRVLRWAYLRGLYGLPLVAWDGSTGGLSADGHRLVLASWPGDGKNGVTRFVVLDPATLRVRARLQLKGAFAFDALSPRGTLVYLIQYLGKPSSGRYAVRALNLSGQRLYRGAIVDRREPDEKMAGQPVTRTGSSNGRWAYTLYTRSGKSPFVHALETVHRRAFCVDLPWHGSPDWINGVKMRVHGGRLVLRRGDTVVARVDRKTLEVRS